MLPASEIRALIEERWPLEEIPAKASSTARRFRFADGAGEIGFMNPVSEPSARAVTGSGSRPTDSCARASSPAASRT